MSAPRGPPGAGGAAAEAGGRSNRGTHAAAAAEQQQHQQQQQREGGRVEISKYIRIVSHRINFQTPPSPCVRCAFGRVVMVM